MMTIIHNYTRQKKLAKPFSHEAEKLAGTATATATAGPAKGP